MKEEVLKLSELARRLDTTTEQIKTWAKEGKFNKTVTLNFEKESVYIKHDIIDSVNSQRKIDQILDEMAFLRGTAEPALSFSSRESQRIRADYILREE